MSDKEEKKVRGIKGLKPWQQVLVHLGLMIVLGLLLLWAAMGFLKVYTRHDAAFRMPDVRGMSQQEANQVLAKAKLYMDITDSVYVESKPAGVILETTPKAGSMIKSKRTVYVTVNTQNVKTLPVPDFSDNTSRRQAEGILRGTGFTNFTVLYVPGPYHDLVLHLKDASGRILMPGQRVAYNEPLTLEVASQEAYRESMLDSLILEGIDEAAAPRSAPTAPEQPQGNDGEDWF